MPYFLSEAYYLVLLSVCLFFSSCDRLPKEVLVLSPIQSAVGATETAIGVELLERAQANVWKEVATVDLVLVLDMQQQLFPADIYLAIPSSRVALHPTLALVRYEDSTVVYVRTEEPNLKKQLGSLFPPISGIRSHEHKSFEEGIFLPSGTRIALTFYFFGDVFVPMDQLVLDFGSVGRIVLKPEISDREETPLAP